MKKLHYPRYFDALIAKLPRSLMPAVKEREHDWRCGQVSIDLFLYELKACLKHKIA